MVWGILVERGAPVEAVAGPDSSGEQAIRDGLGEQIGELSGRQRTYQMGPKCLEETSKHTTCILFELVADDTSEVACPIGEFFGERFGCKIAG